jgi:hypothetical protein
MKNRKEKLVTVLILPVLGNASKEDEGQARCFPLVSCLLCDVAKMTVIPAEAGI